MIIGVLNYKYCNFYSIYSKLDILSPNIKIIEKANELMKCDKIVIPGTGSAHTAMNYLEKKGFVDEIKNFHEKDKFILGICLGMQIFFNKLYEGEEAKGFNFFNSNVVSLESKQKIITNVGWRKLIQNKFSENLYIDNKTFNDLQYYFCHSYHVSIKKSEKKFVKYFAKLKEEVSNTYNNNLIPSVIEKENILGFQFHPEKSQKLGMIALRKFIDL